MKIIAHGGYSGKYKENTIESYIAALEFNPDFIEMDVCETSEGIVLCYHPEIEREGQLVPKEKLRHKEILNNHPDVATLETVIKKLKNRTKFVFDLKQGSLSLINAIYDLVNICSLEYDQFIFGIRTPELLKASQKLHPTIQTLGLWEDPATYKQFFDLGGNIFRLRDRFVAAERVTKIHEYGSQVWGVPKTENQGKNRSSGEITQDKFHYFIQCGLDGIMINNLELIKKVLPNRSM